MVRAAVRRSTVRCMRATIEITDPLYRRLKAAAAHRGLRGLSPLVEDALAEYLAAEPERRDVLAAIEAAEGAWSEDDVTELEEARRRAWSECRLDPSSTATS